MYWREPFTILDGGLSTALERAGHDLRHELWTARLVRDDPDAIVDAHLAYMRAGAEIVITSSYQASRSGFMHLGVSADDADALVASTTALARRAVVRFVDESLSRARQPLVAASVGPYGAVLADGSEYTGAYAIDRGALVDFHCLQLDVLVRSAPDLLAIETIPGVDEALAIGEALASVPGASKIDTLVTYTCRDGAHTATGDPIEEAVGAAAGVSGGVVAVGVNCTAPEHVGELLERAARATSLPLVAYPNAGQRWDGRRHTWRGVGDGEIGRAGLLERWIAAGARLIGGCCGIGPAEIANLARRRDNVA